METAVVAIVLAIAAIATGRRIWRGLRVAWQPPQLGSGGGCGGGCNSCGDEPAADPPLVQLRRRPPP